MSDIFEKSHVLTNDCIIGEIGRCEAGLMIDEGDVNPSTWQWLLDRNFVCSKESIDAEADAKEEPDTEDSVEQPTEEVATDTQPEAELIASTVVTEEVAQPEQPTSEAVESPVVTEEVATDAQPELKVAESTTVVTTEPKPTGRRTRRS